MIDDYIMTKPSIPKGTRDFGAIEMARRNYIFDTIKAVFAQYGFQQIQTPAMENISTLMGKYGEEGDKLLFRIQNSGEKANEAPEKGLRYDLTVPFARYVVQHREELQFPFRRFQIQPVWRADRPQKGRYREFYQCDVDVIGTDSLMSEVELIQIVEEVYRRLGLRVCLHLNNRKILAGIAEVIGAEDKLIDITTAIDKLDKIGTEAVNAELIERGLSAEAVEKMQPILSLSGSNEEKLEKIGQLLSESETGRKGVEETQTILQAAAALGVNLPVELDLTLARGLNYYTGAIFEVKALDVQIGSITGGGRYDNLTGIFGLPGVSGVGISFGADRIYDCLLEQNLYPESMLTGTQLLLTTFGQEELNWAMQVARELRQAGLRVEVYPEPCKMKRQMGYADAKQIPWVGIIGGDELAAKKVMLKNMASGEQELISIEDIIRSVNR